MAETARAVSEGHSNLISASGTGHAERAIVVEINQIGIGAIN